MEWCLGHLPWTPASVATSEQELHLADPHGNPGAAVPTDPAAGRAAWPVPSPPACRLEHSLPLLPPVNPFHALRCQLRNPAPRGGTQVWRKGDSPPERKRKSPEPPSTVCECLLHSGRVGRVLNKGVKSRGGRREPRWFHAV